eukprot:7215500-Pyramimonas_sp.AAC.1
MLEEKKRELKQDKVEYKRMELKAKRKKVKQAERDLRQRKRRIVKYRQRLKEASDERMEEFNDPPERYSHSHTVVHSCSERRSSGLSFPGPLTSASDPMTAVRSRKGSCPFRGQLWPEFHALTRASH